MKIKNMIIATLFMLLPSLALAELTVEAVWVRMPPPVADTAAAYLVLNNSGDADVSIIAVESDVADKPAFHSMSMDDGMMHMQKMEIVLVPAHGKLKFSPGGNHLMLKHLTKKLNAGDYVMLKLNTSDGQSLEVHARVRDMRKMQDHHGEHHGEHHDDHHH